MPYSDPAAQREYQRKWIAARRTAWLAEHGPCIDCGSWKHLEVDHVDAAAKVEHKVWSWAAHRREAELAKCVVRCRSCHNQKRVACQEHAFGVRHGAAKLTVDDVLAIRESPLPQRALAAQYGISQSQICRIRRRQEWASVGNTSRDLVE